MKRIPPYVVVALCGLLFISAGLIGMFADSTETVVPADAGDQALLPTATMTLTATPMEVIAPEGQVSAPVEVVQPAPLPANNPPPVVVEAPPAEVQPIPSAPLESVPAEAPTQTIPVEAPPVEAPPAEVVPVESFPAEVTVEAVAPVQDVPAESAPVEDVPAVPPAPEVIPSDVPAVEPTPADITSQESRDVSGSVLAAPVPTRVIPDVPVEQPTLPVIEVIPTEVVVPVEPTGGEAVPVVPTAITGDTVDTVPVIPTADPVLIPTVESIAPTSEPAEMTPVAAVPAQISGLVTLQEAQDHTGITVLLTLPDGRQLQNITGAPGTFEFLNLQPGAYRVEAFAQGYLARQMEFTLTEGQVFTLPSTFLVAGDTNFDNVIDVNDAALVASNFDGPATVPSADPNRDGWVDVRDLALIGADFGLSGPIPWE